MLGFVIVGWPTKQKTIGAVLIAYCHLCNNESGWYLIKRRKWLTLFWIPILPLSRKEHYLVCDVCANAHQLQRSELAETRNMMEVTAKFERGIIDQEKYISKINDFAGQIDAGYAGDEDEPINATTDEIRGIQ